MKLLLAIIQLVSSIHVDQQNGIIFIKDKPVRLYKKYEKVYLDTIIRSPRELLNYGELNFPLIASTMTKTIRKLKIKTCLKSWTKKKGLSI